MLPTDPTPDAPENAPLEKTSARAVAPPAPGTAPERHVTTPWKRLRRNWIAMGSLVILVLVTLFAIIVPEITPADKRVASEQTEDRLRAPDATYLLGTDINRRDLLYRLGIGARISLGVGLAAALINIVVGSAYGMVAGYFGGRVDSAMMRLVDILYSIPRLIVVLVFINALDRPLKDFMDHVYLQKTQAMAGVDTHPGPATAVVSFALDLCGLGNPKRKGDADSLSRIVILVITLGLIEWLSMARIVRGQVLSLKERQYVTASRALGQGNSRIILKHLLPNLVGIIITYLTLTIPAVILDESFLSYLGLGVQEPLASWGSLLKDGSANINPVKSFWWILVFPALTMSVTLLALNFLGDGLRDAFDPKEKR